jgi:hypothetical protein
VKFARWTFLLAGVYGLVVLLPQYFLAPADLARPELFYGFVGVAIAWQVAFLTIALDPVRFRPMMVAAVVEKASFAIATIALYAGEKVQAPVLAAGVVDLALGVLFAFAWLGLRERRTG